jgi:thioredoxin 1
MRIVTLIITLLHLPSIIFGKVDFFQGSLNEVQRIAALEGKLYFIDFYAAYCLPCKLMDETTFMNPELGDYVKANYVPLKLNINAFDAYEVRTKHEVNLLPTVMIFNSSGELLESYEGVLTASKLRGMLEKYNIPANRKKTTPPPVEPNYADEIEVSESAKPSKAIATEAQPNKVELKKEEVAIAKPETSKPISSNKPVAKVISEPIAKITKPNADNIVFGAATNPPSSFSTKVIPKPVLIKPTLAPPIQEAKPITPQQVSKPVQQEPKPKAKGLYEFRATPHPTKGFVIQIGIFAEYSNVLNEVELIQQLFPEHKVIVHIDEMNNTTVYRVAVGTFTSAVTARNFMATIKAKGFEGFVKDLSTLQ